MLRQILGIVMTLLGLLILLYGPGDGRPQTPSYASTSVLVGLVLMVVGVLLIKL